MTFTGVILDSLARACLMFGSGNMSLGTPVSCRICVTCSRPLEVFLRFINISSYTFEPRMTSPSITNSFFFIHSHTVGAFRNVANTFCFPYQTIWESIQDNIRCVECFRICYSSFTPMSMFDFKNSRLLRCVEFSFHIFWDIVVIQNTGYHSFNRSQYFVFRRGHPIKGSRIHHEQLLHSLHY